MKDMDLDATKSGSYNPYRALLFKLIDKKVNAPRQLSAANTWSKTQREAIAAEVQSRLKQLEDSGKDPIPKSQLLAFRDVIVREMFLALTDGEQRDWYNVAIANHQKAMKDWKKELEAPIKTDPVSRQM